MNLTGPPETVLYSLFFQEANGLAAKAVALSTSGTRPAALKVIADYYGIEAGLTRPQNDIVFQVASAYARAEDRNRSEAKNLVTAWHKANLAYSISQGPKRKSILPQLQQLELQRYSDLMADRLRLKALLGRNGFYALEVYVHHKFGAARPDNVQAPRTVTPDGGSNG